MKLKKNPWLYHTFKFILFCKAWGECWCASMWPWSYLCEHQWVTKMMEQSTEWCVLHWGDKSTHNSHWRIWYQVGYTPWWRVMSRQSDQWRVQDRCPQFPLDINKDPCSHAKTAAITLSPHKAALIYFHNFATPPANKHKKSCKEQLKMKSDIALWQNCDQSVTVWWSAQSSAWHWRVGEWRLTMNKSGDDKKETT